MPSVADLVEPDVIRGRAGEYLARAGQVLRDGGNVRLGAFGPTRVTAEVVDRETRDVVLESSPAGLVATCGCGGTADALCPHLVAAALETWERAPRRR